MMNSFIGKLMQDCNLFDDMSTQEAEVGHYKNNELATRLFSTYCHTNSIFPTGEEFKRDFMLKYFARLI